MKNIPLKGHPGAVHLTYKSAIRLREVRSGWLTITTVIQLKHGLPALGLHC